MDNKDTYIVTSEHFYADMEYVEWLDEIKERYRRTRNRIVLQANYGALEFNWMLGRDIVQKLAVQKWGDGVVEQLSLDLSQPSLM